MTGEPPKIPYLHVRPPRRVVGVRGEGDRPLAYLCANRAGLLALRARVDAALAAEASTWALIGRRTSAGKI